MGSVRWRLTHSMNTLQPRAAARQRCSLSGEAKSSLAVASEGQVVCGLQPYMPQFRVTPWWCVTIRNLIKYRSFQANIQRVFPAAQERVAARGELFLRQRTSPGDPQSVPHNTAGLIRRVATSNIRLLPKPWQSFLDSTNDDIALQDEIRISKGSCLHPINIIGISPLSEAKWRESVVTLNLKQFFCDLEINITMDDISIYHIDRNITFHW